MAENLDSINLEGNGDFSSSSNNGQITVNQVKFVGIEYPGYIQDEKCMLETLGGEETVAKTFSSPAGRRLEMSFRPEDPYCHAVCADRYSTANLLLRVKQRKKKRKDGSEEPAEVKYEQEILGIVGNTFKFEVLADFQYLVPDMPDVLKEVKGADALNQDIPLHLPPPVFARFDQPASYNYRSEPQTGNKLEHNLDRERLGGLSGRLRRPANAIALNFSMAEVPSAPNPKAVELANKIKDGHVETITKLFNNRPIWSRTALQCHIHGASQERLKQLLASVAYYWLNGPWRTLWTRIGYDPRKDPSAKVYQMLDYRIGSRKETKDLPIKAKRDSSVYKLPNLVKKTSSKTLVREVVMISNDDKTDDKQSQEQDFPYVFTPNKMPTQKQQFYQLCDLHDPEIQRVVSKNDGQERDCHERDGWCSSGANDEIRAILYRRTTDLAERLKQEQSGEGVEQPISQLTWEGEEQSISQSLLTGEEWCGHEGVKNYLEMLQQDDDIEAYDIFDDLTEGDD